MGLGIRSRLLIVAVIAAGALGLTLFILHVLSGTLWEDECQNTILSEYPSPDGKRKVVVFERSCGATTGFSTQASLLSSDQKLSGDHAGNLYIADDNHGAAAPGPGGGPPLFVRWENARSLTLTSAPGARVFLAREETEDIHVKYISNH